MSGSGVPRPCFQDDIYAPRVAVLFSARLGAKRIDGEGVE
jgi:hypothetical protein